MPSAIQSVLFLQREWSPMEARMWLRRHKITPMKRMERTGNYLHYRIRDPKKMKRIRTKKTEKGITLRIGFY